MSDRAYRLYRWLRRLVVFVIGATVTLFGIVLFFTPGPAIVVVPLGLMILATEFAWARVILTRVKAQITRMRTSGKPEPPAPAPAPAPADASPASPVSPAPTASPQPPPPPSGPGGPPHEG